MAQVRGKHRHADYHHRRHAGNWLHHHAGNRLRRHAGLDPASSLIMCRWKRLLDLLDSCFRRNGGRETGLDSCLRWNGGRETGLDSYLRWNGDGSIRRNDSRCLRRHAGICLRRHAGLDPASSLVMCRPRLTICRGRPWRLFVSLDSGIRRNDDGGGMTVGPCAGMAVGACAGMAVGQY